MFLLEGMEEALEEGLRKQVLEIWLRRKQMAAGKLRH
jgi:hypothetical protein